jgi:hypothetical protein
LTETDLSAETANKDSLAVKSAGDKPLQKNKARVDIFGAYDGTLNVSALRRIPEQILIPS